MHFHQSIFNGQLGCFDVYDQLPPVPQCFEPFRKFRIPHSARVKHLKYFQRRILPTQTYGCGVRMRKSQQRNRNFPSWDSQPGICMEKKCVFPRPFWEASWCAGRAMLTGAYASGSTIALSTRRILPTLCALAGVSVLRLRCLYFCSSRVQFAGCLI